jgi:hypothetical protein
MFNHLFTTSGALGTVKDSLMATDVTKARVLAAQSLRSRAACYRSIGAECFNESLAIEVEALALELMAAASALDAMN